MLGTFRSRNNSLKASQASFLSLNTTRGSAEAADEALLPLSLLSLPLFPIAANVAAIAASMADFSSASLVALAAATLSSVVDDDDPLADLSASFASGLGSALIFSFNSASSGGIVQTDSFVSTL